MAFRASPARGWEVVEIPIHGLAPVAKVVSPLRGYETKWPNSRRRLKARDYKLDCNRLHLMYTQSGGPPSVQRVVREMFHEIAKSS